MVINFLKDYEYYSAANKQMHFQLRKLLSRTGHVKQPRACVSPAVSQGSSQSEVIHTSASTL